MSRPLEDYGLIGDGQSAAQVSRNAPTDRPCGLRLDDDACFVALVGTLERRYWSKIPVAATGKLKRLYCDDTLALKTDFEIQEGTVRVIDFMPLREHSPAVGADRGQTALHRPMQSTLRPRFDDGLMPPWLSSEAGGVIARDGADFVAVRADAANHSRGCQACMCSATAVCSPLRCEREFSAQGTKRHVKSCVHLLGPHFARFVARSEQVHATAGNW